MSLNTSLVTTVIAAPSACLDEPLLRHFSDVLQVKGGRDTGFQWQKEGAVADIFCTGVTMENIYACLKPFLANRPIDLIVQPAANREKKLLLVDMESTIIQQEMIVELADLLGLREMMESKTNDAMNNKANFTTSLFERTAYFIGQPESLLAKAAERITPMPGAHALITTMKEKGASCWMVTGGLIYFARLVAKRLGLDRFFANDLIIENGLMTGDFRKPILGPEEKKAVLLQACQELGLSLADCLVIGDGSNDIPMLTACNEGGGLGVAYHAKEAVRKAVPHQLNHADLSALVYAQGLPIPSISPCPSSSQSSPRQNADRLSGRPAAGQVCCPFSQP